MKGGHGGFRCGIDGCSKVFTRAVSLRRHAKTYTQQKCLARRQTKKQNEAEARLRKNTKRRDARMNRPDEVAKTQAAHRREIRNKRPAEVQERQRVEQTARRRDARMKRPAEVIQRQNAKRRDTYEQQPAEVVQAQNAKRRGLYKQKNEFLETRNMLIYNAAISRMTEKEFDRWEDMCGVEDEGLWLQLRALMIEQRTGYSHMMRKSYQRHNTYNKLL